MIWAFIIIMINTLNINTMGTEQEQPDKPVIMYIHGFMSGANGSKPRQLEKQFGDRYRILAPELTADPDESLEQINRLIAREHPSIIIGTSLGGWMAMACESGDADVVVVNPCIDPRQQLAMWAGQTHEYFCKRLDGRQTYTLTQETLDKYAAYPPLDALVEAKGSHLHALCTTADELLGASHLEALRPLLPADRLMIVDDFGHQCNGPGLQHLFTIIETLTPTTPVGD